MTKAGNQGSEKFISTPLMGLIGLLVGAGWMFFLDRSNGARRRRRALDQITHLQRVALKTYDRRTRDLGNRIYGRFIETKNSLAGVNPVNDLILADRIRSKIGRVLSHPRMVQIDCEGGRVRLNGVALSSEMNRLYDCVRHVRGVKSILVNNVRPVKDDREISYVASQRLWHMDQGATTHRLSISRKTLETLSSSE